MAWHDAATGLLLRNLRDGVRHAAHQQDALGADRARRRHRHHVDRRHDVADPRLRQVAARIDQPARARTRSSCRSAARSASRRGKSFLEVVRRPNLTMEDARAIERELPVGRAGRRLARRRRATRRSRIYLRQRAHQAAGGDRRHRELVGGQLRQARSSAASSSRRKSSTARSVVVLGNGPWQVAVPQHRSDRQEGPHRHRRSSPSSACSASGRARAASPPAPTTSRSSRTAPTRSSTARC